MAEVGAEGLFALFEHYPSLLPPAPANAGLAAMKARVAITKPPCLRCAKQTRVVMIAVHKTSGRRWIDLCGDCSIWVKEAIARQSRRKAERDAAEGEPS